MEAFNLVASSRYIVIVTMIINNGQAGDDQIDINLTRLQAEIDLFTNSGSDWSYLLLLHFQIGKGLILE